MTELIIGISLAIAIVLSARLSRFEKDRSFYPVLLIVIAFYYVLFAFQSFHKNEILFEVFVAIIFSVLAIWGHHINLKIVGLALILHGFYDLMHHSIPVATNPPEWWPLFCFGVDVILGVWLLILFPKPEK